MHRNLRSNNNYVLYVIHNYISHIYKIHYSRVTGNMTIHVCICVLTHVYLMLYVYLCGNDYESASNDTCFMMFHTSRTGRLFTISLRISFTRISWFKKKNFNLKILEFIFAIFCTKVFITGFPEILGWLRIYLIAKGLQKLEYVLNDEYCNY